LSDLPEEGLRLKFTPPCLSDNQPVNLVWEYDSPETAGFPEKIEIIFDLFW